MQGVMGMMFKVVDNSGTKTVKLIKGKLLPGEILTVVRVKATKKKQDSKVGHAILLTMRRELKRKDGTRIRTSNNSCTMVDKDKNPVATRIFSPVPYELRAKGYTKLLSLSKQHF